MWIVVRICSAIILQLLGLYVFVFDLSLGSLGTKEHKDLNQVVDALGTR